MTDIDLTKFEGHTESLAVGEQAGEVVLFDDDGIVIARVGEIGTDDRIEADARLFAAAPDLLQKVRRLRDAYGRIIMELSSLSKSERRKSISESHEYSTRQRFWAGGMNDAYEYAIEIIKAAVEGDQ